MIGIPDLAVLEDTGPLFFINDSTGSISLDDSVSAPGSNAIEILDLNSDGKPDILIATSQGVSVQIADDFLSYSEYQLILSGDARNILLYDFDDDRDADMVTVNNMNQVRFIERTMKMKDSSKSGYPFRFMDSGI